MKETKEDVIVKAIDYFSIIGKLPHTIEEDNE